MRIPITIDNRTDINGVIGLLELNEPYATMVKEMPDAFKLEISYNNIGGKLELYGMSLVTTKNYNQSKLPKPNPPTIIPSC